MYSFPVDTIWCSADAEHEEYVPLLQTCVRLSEAGQMQGLRLGREVLEVIVNATLAAHALPNRPDAVFEKACKGLLVSCERWALLSEVSRVLQLLQKAHIEIPCGFHGRLIEAVAKRLAATPPMPSAATSRHDNTSHALSSMAMSGEWGAEGELDTDG
eukprot:CAMPEP_0173068190 /NCGR_PEP_ID=MMETSP1102-20130122/7264_1 /TAXON_ID=49646 /ORGANISM="Geminigera sp., Strain Caron Lab Isolate" /LENGTH=157 /DNA_ID=CAMNT_0013936001 /DNA_START=340 /DNA_END=810 /DNA_ORIENTATION=+